MDLTILAAGVTETTNWEYLVRLLAASLLGGLIGLEREHHGRSAGLRTQLLVALGSALAMVVSLRFGDVYGPASAPGIRVDPARVAYGVMGGVGFLGAGAIIHYGVGIRGLTTAASLWCSAAIGLGCGFGMFLVAVGATAIVLFALMALDTVERLVPVRQARNLTLTVPDTSPDVVARDRELLRQANIRVVSVTSTLDFKAGQTTIGFFLSVTGDDLARAVNLLRQQAKDISLLKVE
jgi:putative Mg2+ transporter-C (MgtC) family protein